LRINRGGLARCGCRRGRGPQHRPPTAAAPDTRRGGDNLLFTFQRAISHKREYLFGLWTD
jgi:hypothetical protein